jgi:hypothetical protein
MAGEGSRKTQFKPGRSGNPKGRPPGSRAKTLATLDTLGEDAAQAILVTMIDEAKGGDVSAARAVLDRVWPARKGARVEFELPEIARANELPAAIARINRQVAEGRLSMEEGALIVGLLEAQRKALETGELAARVVALEERMQSK